MCSMLTCLLRSKLGLYIGQEVEPVGGPGGKPSFSAGTSEISHGTTSQINMVLNVKELPWPNLALSCLTISDISWSDLTGQ